MLEPKNALVRAIPRSYAEYYAGKSVVISSPTMQAQHAAYINALKAAGLGVSVLAADECYPDCVFIEDTAVVWGGRALMACMTEHRQGEQTAVEQFLRTTHAITPLEPGARLDGGDVLHVERTTYVGLSQRTNAAGAEALASFLEPQGRRVVPIRVDRCLHLKSAATSLGDGALLAAPDLLDITAFDVNEVIVTVEGESHAANCLRIGGHLLALAAYPQTLRRLESFAAKYDLKVTALHMSEFAKGDGSLTCLSLIW